ncbi:MAG: hypothetical protein Q7T11_00300 [Deltaproteobacteria bacterium]|nr:hypothetical protein [Deltaproteobacteria bacterium]
MAGILAHNVYPALIGQFKTPESEEARIHREEAEREAAQARVREEAVQQEFPKSMQARIAWLGRWLDMDNSGLGVLAGASRPLWRSHLDQNKSNILQAASEIRTEGRRPVAMVLGAGNCIDIPLHELIERGFDVVLVDLDPRGMRRAVKALPPDLRRHVTIEVRDVTGNMVLDIAERTDEIIQKAPSAEAAVREFVDYIGKLSVRIPDLSNGRPVDLMVSSMLTSQLRAFIIGKGVRGALARKFQADVSFEIESRPDMRQFYGRIQQAHAMALAQFVNRTGGTAYYSADFLQYTRLTRPDYLERRIPIIFDLQGDSIENMEEHLGGVPVTGGFLPGWEWHFAGFEDRPDIAAIVRAVAPGLANAILDRRMVEAAIITPGTDAKAVQALARKTEISPSDHGEGLWKIVTPPEVSQASEAEAPIDFAQLYNAIHVSEARREYLDDGQWKKFSDAVDAKTVPECLAENPDIREGLLKALGNPAVQKYLIPHGGHEVFAAAVSLVLAGPKDKKGPGNGNGGNTGNDPGGLTQGSSAPVLSRGAPSSKRLAQHRLHRHGMTPLSQRPSSPRSKSGLFRSAAARVTH